MSVSQRPCGKSVLSLDLNLDSESQRIIVSGSKFQTVGAEQRKAQVAKSILVNGLSSSGAVVERSIRSLTRLRNDLYCVEWDVKLYYTIPSIH